MLQWYIVDLSQKDDKTKASKYSNILQELILPYYTGPMGRIMPSLFVLRGDLAYIINGPDPVLALKQKIQLFMKKTAA